MNESKCQKCGIPIIFTGCVVDQSLLEKAKKKEINYVISGLPPPSNIKIQPIKRKCVKCGTEF